MAPLKKRKRLSSSRPSPVTGQKKKEARRKYQVMDLEGALEDNAQQIQSTALPDMPEDLSKSFIPYWCRSTSPSFVKPTCLTPWTYNHGSSFTTKSTSTSFSWAWTLFPCLPSFSWAWTPFPCLPSFPWARTPFPYSTSFPCPSVQCFFNRY